jgi:indole-3-pyruvate monooxygenase
MSEIERIDTMVVGAGPAGLAVGACMQRADLPFVIIEQGDRVGASWSQHYDRLHLHTDSRHSGLPYWPWPKNAPRYPSRQEVLSYLERYALHFDLRPRFGQRVSSAERRASTWVVRAADCTYEASSLVIATGMNSEPLRPTWPGQEAYEGQVLHSSEYRNGAAFAGQPVLVVGMGNSGAEIAIDLYEHGARPVLSVRGPVNIISREVLGLPFLYIAIPMLHLPAGLADMLARPISRLATGNRGRLGLPVPSYGPNTQIRKLKKVPVIDVGTVDLIHRGKIGVRPGIERFTQTGVQFTDGAREDFAAVILATGYQPALTAFLTGANAALDATGAPLHTGGESGLPGLFFCGLSVAPAGAFREIGFEAREIARAIARGGAIS